jgi:hypothetical protein
MPEVLAALRRCRELIHATQLADGALAMNAQGERVRIVPILRTMRRFALLAAHELDPQPDDVRARNGRGLTGYVAPHRARRHDLRPWRV